MCSFIRSGALWRTRLAFLNTSGFMSEHLRRERDDLHVLLLAQFARHGTEDTGRLWLALVVDEDGGILVEPDVGPVLPTDLLRGAHDDRLEHLALLHLAGRDRVLDGHDHAIAERRIAPPGPAQHADHQRLSGAGIVRDLDDTFLLYHGLSPRASARPLNNGHRAPMDRLGERPRFHDPHRVAGFG